MNAIERIKAEQAKALKDIGLLTGFAARHTACNPWLYFRHCEAPSRHNTDTTEAFVTAFEQRDLVALMLASQKIHLPGYEMGSRPLTSGNVFRKLAVAVATASGITEVMDWYRSFEETVHTKGPTEIANCLVQIGVEISGTCDCAEDFEVGPDAIDMAYPAIWWLHNHHRLWNTAIHELLVEIGKLQAVRAVLRRDVKIDDAELEGFGKIVFKEYGELLLTHFLKSKPDVAWIDPTVTDAYTPADSSAADSSAA